MIKHSIIGVFFLLDVEYEEVKFEALREGMVTYVLTTDYADVRSVFIFYEMKQDDNNNLIGILKGVNRWLSGKGIEEFIVKSNIFIDFQ